MIDPLNLWGNSGPSSSLMRHGLTSPWCRAGDGSLLHSAVRPTLRTLRHQTLEITETQDWYCRSSQLMAETRPAIHHGMAGAKEDGGGDVRTTCPIPRTRCVGGNQC